MGIHGLYKFFLEFQRGVVFEQAWGSEAWVDRGRLPHEASTRCNLVESLASALRRSRGMMP